MQNSRDLSRRRFGRLIVSYKDESRKNKRHTHWICLCDCGTQVSVRASHLLTGNTKSCGCLAREHVARFAKVKDMTGSLVFGWKVVRKATEFEKKAFLGIKTLPRNRQKYWICQCVTCGKSNIYCGQTLRQGKVGICKHK